MKFDEKNDKYIEKGLIDSTTYITDNIIDSDLDFKNIVGINHIIEQKENSLLGKGKTKNQEYKESLENIMKEYSDLFFYSDIEHNRLYFEYLVGSKTEVNRKYLFKSLIFEVENKSCPKCSSKLKIRPIENLSTKVDGKTANCQKYAIYCMECEGIFGIFGYNLTHIFKSLFFETKKFLKSLESVKFGVTNEIKFNSTLDSVYRC